MSDLVKCIRCRKILVDEEYDSHKCAPNVVDSKTIKSASHYITKDNQGRIVIGIRGLNGICYEFIEIPEDKLHTKTPYQPTVNTNNNSREDNSTILWVLSSLWDIFSLSRVGT